MMLCLGRKNDDGRNALGSVATRATPGAALAVAAAAFVGWSATADAREIQPTTVELDLSTGEFEASVIFDPDEAPFELTSATEIADKIFIHLDLSVAMNADTQNEIEKMVDQGFTSEPSGCEPNVYGPLDMEDGLRYFFDIGLATQEQVQVTIYPGNRSTHWTNDVFCEYDAEKGDESATFRLTGFYYVIHRTLKDAIDIQLRPITPSPEEIQLYLKP